MPLPSDIEHVNRRPARHVVYDLLRDWVQTGVLRPGEILKDQEIATRLGVSRTPVREALQMLEQIGVVEMLPGSSTRVALTTPDDASRVYPILAVLQGLAAEYGTLRATAEDVVELDARNDDLLRAIRKNDPEAARDADTAFHAVLVRLAANPFLEQALAPLLLHIRRLEIVYFADREPSMESHTEHRQIIDAVSAGDGGLARACTERNFQRYVGSRATAPTASAAGEDVSELAQ